MTKILFLLTLLSSQAFAAMEFQKNLENHINSLNKKWFSGRTYHDAAYQYYNNYKSADKSEIGKPKEKEFETLRYNYMILHSKEYLNSHETVSPKDYKEYQEDYKEMTGKDLFSSELITKLERSEELSPLEMHEYQKATKKYYIALLIEHAYERPYEQVKDVLSRYEITEEQYSKYNPENKEYLHELVASSYEKFEAREAGLILQHLQHFDIKKFDAIPMGIKVKILDLLHLDKELIDNFKKGDKESHQKVKNIIEERIKLAAKSKNTEAVVAYYQDLQNRMKRSNIAYGVGFTILFIILAIMLSNQSQISQAQQSIALDSPQE